MKIFNLMQIFEKTSMKQLRKKSLLLTAYLEHLLDHYFGKDSPFRTGKAFYELVTPRDPEHRGLSIVPEILCESAPSLPRATIERSCGKLFVLILTRM